MNKKQFIFLFLLGILGMLSFQSIQYVNADNHVSASVALKMVVSNPDLTKGVATVNGGNEVPLEVGTVVVLQAEPKYGYYWSRWKLNGTAQWTTAKYPRVVTYTVTAISATEVTVSTNIVNASHPEYSSYTLPISTNMVTFEPVFSGPTNLNVQLTSMAGVWLKAVDQFGNEYKTDKPSSFSDSKSKTFSIPCGVRLDFSSSEAIDSCYVLGDWELTNAKSSSKAALQQILKDTRIFEVLSSNFSDTKYTLTIANYGKERNWHLDLSAVPSTKGSVSVSDSEHPGGYSGRDFSCGQFPITLTATPISGGSFLRWSDEPAGQPSTIGAVRTMDDPSAWGGKDTLTISAIFEEPTPTAIAETSSEDTMTTTPMYMYVDHGQVVIQRGTIRYSLDGRILRK